MHSGGRTSTFFLIYGKSQKILKIAITKRDITLKKIYQNFFVISD